MSAEELSPAEPIVAEAVSPRQHFQFGLRSLLLLMAVCSVQFAVMSYAGVFLGIMVSLLLAIAAFAGVFLVGILPGLFGAQQVRRLDQAIVWLMIAILALFFGTLLAGGGVAVWTTGMRFKNEAWMERSIGAGLARQVRIDNSEVRQVLAVTSVRTGSPADFAGLKTGDVVVLDVTIDQFYKSLQANRGGDVELNVAACNPTQALDKAPRRTLSLGVPSN